MSIGQTPNHAKCCGDPTRSVWDICDRKFVLPKKVGQNSPKSLKTCYPVKLPIMPNFIEIGETILEKKRLQIFYTLQYFGSPEGHPGPKVTGLGGGVYLPPSSYLLNFVPFWRPLSEISAAKLRRLCCRRDPQKSTVNDVSPHYMRWRQNLVSKGKLRPFIQSKNVSRTAYIIYTGCANKNNPLGKIHYLSYCKSFFHQIYIFHRGGFRPHTQQISLQYLLCFRNCNNLKLKIHFSEWTSN